MEKQVNNVFVYYSLRVVMIFLFFSAISFAQIQKTDSIGNFYVSQNKLIWEKYFPLDDVNELNEQLKSNYFTSNLDILKYTTSAMSNASKLTGINLPQYAQSDFETFIVVDIIGNNYRITVKDITFTEFIETWYYNGRKEYSGRGRLDYYVLRQDKVIKRNNGTYSIFNALDNAFMEIFSYYE